MPIKLKKKGLESLQDTLEELRARVLTVGFQGRSGADRYPTKSGKPGPNVASVALFNEFGTKNIPARPFLRSSFVGSRGELEKVAEDALRPILRRSRRATAVAGSEHDQAFVLLGRGFTRRIKAHIRAARTWAKPNAPSTVAKKGSSDPLRETDRLLKAVSWAIRPNSAKGPILKQGSSK